MSDTKSRKPTEKPAKTDDSGSLSKFLERILSPLTAVSTVTLAVIGVTTNLSSFAKQWTTHPFLVAVLISILCVSLIYAVIDQMQRRGRMTTRQVRLAHGLLFILFFLVLIVGVVRTKPCWFGGDKSQCGPSDWLPFFAIRRAQAQSPAPLEVVGVSIDEEHSTFSLGKGKLSIHALMEDTERISVEFDRRMFDVFRLASCIGVDGEAPIEDALPIWRELLQQRGRDDLVAQLADYDGYRDLITSGGADSFNKARPNNAELSELMMQKPQWYKIILRWMAKCVGIADPVLIYTLRNNTSGDLTLASIDDDVLDVGKVASGGAAETIDAVDVPPHDLLHKTGLQPHALSQLVVLKAKQVALIRVRYRLEATDWGLTWLIQPAFNTLENVSAKGPEIKIYSAKNPSK